MKITGIAMIIVDGLLYALLGGADEDPRSFVGVIVMIGGILVHFRGRRIAAKARAKSRSSPLADNRPDVLYLKLITGSVLYFIACLDY